MNLLHPIQYPGQNLVRAALMPLRAMSAGATLLRSMGSGLYQRWHTNTHSHRFTPRETVVINHLKKMLGAEAALPRHYLALKGPAGDRLANLSQEDRKKETVAHLTETIANLRGKQTFNKLKSVNAELVSKGFGDIEHRDAKLLVQNGDNVRQKMGYEPAMQRPLEENFVEAINHITGENKNDQNFKTSTAESLEKAQADMVQLKTDVDTKLADFTTALTAKLDAELSKLKTNIENEAAGKASSTHRKEAKAYIEDLMRKLYATTYRFGDGELNQMLTEGMSEDTVVKFQNERDKFEKDEAFYKNINPSMVEMIKSLYILTQ